VGLNLAAAKSASPIDDGGFSCIAPFQWLDLFNDVLGQAPLDFPLEGQG
jgi:hypothetical protein